MIKVVNEPQAEYRIAGWQSELEDFYFEYNICSIENETVISCPLGRANYMMFYDKPKKKLSALRGKLTKQSKKEIDDQISELRSEWDRNI